MISRISVQFRLALQFLTVFPIGTKGAVENRDLTESVKFYPVIGGIIGFLISLLFVLFTRIFPSFVTGVLLTAAVVLVTGGLHADGLMDTADGIGSRKGREQMLEIMRDSRVGALGVVGGLLVLLLKTALFVSFTGYPSSVWLLPIVFAGSRLAMVIAMSGFPYARSNGGLGSAYAKSVKNFDLMLAILFFICIACLLLAMTSITPMEILSGLLVGLGIVAASARLLGFYFTQKLGGLTGDTYGAINEMTELLLMVVAIGLQTQKIIG